MDHLKSIQRLSVFLLFLFSLSTSVAAAGQGQPNILFLFSDDQRDDTIAAYGNKEIRTPNLDQLVKTGTSFRRNYCMGSMHGAVCQPSRAMLMSGRTLYRVSMTLKQTPIFPEIFRVAGYETFATGKWHNGAASLIRGFTQGKNVFMGGMSNHKKVPLHDLDSKNKKLVNKRIGNGFSSQLFADATIDFLKSHKQNSKKPFLAYVSFSAPHDPRMPPNEFLKPYWPDHVSLPKNFLPQHPFDTGWMIGRDESLAAWPRTKAVVQQQLAEYYGMITHLDHQIGRIITTLNETGLRKNTIIVFTSDHGLAIGSHGLLGKQNLYEVGMRAPLVVVGDGVPAGASSNALVYLYDLMPTLCDWAVISIPAGVEGKSLLQVIQGKASFVRESLFTAYENSQRAVTDGRWKLIRYPLINKSQLFDLDNDPHEMHDLASDEKYQAELKRLFALLLDWQKKVADKAPLTSTNPNPEKIDLTGHPRKPDRHQPSEIVEKYFQ